MLEFSLDETVYDLSLFIDAITNKSVDKQYVGKVTKITSEFIEVTYPNCTLRYESSSKNKLVKQDPLKYILLMQSNKPLKGYVIAHIQPKWDDRFDITLVEVHFNIDTANKRVVELYSMNKGKEGYYDIEGEPIVMF